jgi:transposase
MTKSLFWLSDKAWDAIEPHLPHGKPGKPCVVISGILHVLKTGCRWREVPPAYGPPTTVYNRYTGTPSVPQRLPIVKYPCCGSVTTAKPPITRWRINFVGESWGSSAT